MSAKRGHLVAVVGRVGCGKSSLISAILGEMMRHQGLVNVDGSVAYVSQEAWIQNCTLKENILFGRPENNIAYDNIMEACALKPDLALFAAGDATEIGEKGVNLSGGQKQRVSLARAVYQDCDVYLMDDPLSAVDAQVGKHIFENVIGPNGLLKHKTRILVTHNVSVLPSADTILTIEDGRISEKGTYHELINHNGPFAEFIKTFMNESGSDSQQEEDTAVFQDEVKHFSSMSSDADMSSENESDVIKLIHHRDSRQLKHCIVNPKLEQAVKNRLSKHSLIQQEIPVVGSIKRAVIKSYIQAASVKYLLLAFIFLFMYAGSIIGSNVWLSKWSDDSTRNVTNAKHLVHFRLGVYAVFATSVVLSCFGLAITIAYGGVKASRHLHHQMISRIMRAPMAFFESTPLDRITNRFSLDTDRIDSLLPETLRHWMNALAPFISVFVIVGYSTPSFLAAMIPLLVLFVVTQTIYTKTARQLRRIDSIKATPIYVYFDETLRGLSSIRAFGQENQFTAKFDNLLDDQMIAWYAVFVGQRWISFYMEIFGCFVIFFATICATLAKDTVSPGVAGLSISYSIQAFFSFSRFIKMSADLETLMVSVERIKEYSEVEIEAHWKSRRYSPDGNWPKTGQITFKDYSTRYRPGAGHVLKSLNFVVRSSEKIGIVGRTGAGKSSLTSALFRIIEPAGGSIFIDQIDISIMGLHDLRSKLTIIPQDPVLFSGSIRMNLDPLNKHTDAEIWTALDHAHLGRFVRNKEEGLYHQCAEDAESMSLGQRQLMCLARALLRESKILVLDEATASVDLKTDYLIQSTIRTEFKKCTILTIAHRLNTIMDYDRILVLHEGKVKEFDSPSNLVNQEESLFYKMAKNAGVISG